jgi:CXXC-20-CXXC protein
MGNLYCPTCNYRFTWKEKWLFSKPSGGRQTSTCPKCGEKLMYTKWPYYFINISGVLLLMHIFMNPMMGSNDWFWPSIIIIVILVLMVIVGSCALKLKKID